MARQLAIEAAGAAISPARLAVALARRGAERRSVARALAAPAPALDDAPARPASPRDGAPLTIFVSAGEASGDLHAANLVRELRARRGSLRVVAFGGERLREAGAEVLEPLAASAGMGLTHGLGSIGAHVALARRFVEALDRERPAVCAFVDNPGFHLVLASLARARGIPAIQYVCPQTWAWAPWRWRRMARDLVAAYAIAPFEAPYFAERGVRVRYVGHPLGDELTPRSIEARTDGRADAPLVALLPGSRRAEVARNLPAMLRVAARIRTAVPAARFAVALSDPVRAAEAEPILREHAVGFPVELHRGSLDPVFREARLTLAKSGTVTLEVAHHAVPLVVFYRLARRSDRLLASLLLNVPHIAILNLLAGREIVPEILATGEADELVAAAAAVGLLRDGPARDAQLAALAEIRRVVSRPGAAARVAESLLAIAERAPAS
ncbi:MAG TPA: lipid-A-disaccharide synthase [Planctomycetota bacterium]|nr:lipid-A-disaccharide synthase [Planctomycetota bacterium]